MKRISICIAVATLLATSVSTASNPDRNDGDKKPKVSLRGYICDAASGEPLIGAGVILSQSAGALLSQSAGAIANNYGFYTITVPAGRHTLTCSYLGYAQQEKTIELIRDTVINFHLTPEMSIAEATVTARKDAGIASAYLGSVEVPLEQIRNAPAVFGESDVLKTIQLMPGVQAGMEGTAGIYVRGGGADENLMLLDGVSIYNVSHMLGLFSVFTPEAVKKVTMYKGSFPAKYSGRISSIVDVRTNDGDMKKFHGTVSAGLLSTKVHFEGPIKKDKTSFSASARMTNTLPFAWAMRLAKSPGIYWFYDLNGKITHRFNDNNKVYLSVYNGLDRLGINDRSKDEFGYGSGTTGSGTTGSGRTQVTSLEKTDITWGNTIVSARWNHVFGHKIFANTTIAYNRYNMNLHSTNTDKTYTDDTLKETWKYTSRFRSGIQDGSVRVEFEYKPDRHNDIQFGTEYIFHDFLPETTNYREKVTSETKPSTDTTNRSKLNSRLKGHEFSLYLEDNISIGKYLTLSPGIHLSVFNTQKKTYVTPEPRASLSFSIKGFSAKASYSKMSQYVHLLTSSQISLPTDLWVPITKDIKPVISDQYSAGLYYAGLKGWEFSIEGYLKNLKNVLEYIDGSMAIGKSSKWEDRVEMGSGRAMGLEFFVQKTAGKTTGWVSYTLAKSDRQFKNGNINNGERFPYKYDRRHNVSICFNHKFNERIDIGATWIFMSGGAITVPERRTTIIEPETGEIRDVAYISQRNNYRLPPTHRLNVGVNFRKQKKNGISIWNVSIYNVYNSLNPNMVFTEESTWTDPTTGRPHTQTKLKKLTMLPIVPSFSYTFRF